MFAPMWVSKREEGWWRAIKVSEAGDCEIAGGFSLSWSSCVQLTVWDGGECAPLTAAASSASERATGLPDFPIVLSSFLVAVLNPSVCRSYHAIGQQRSYSMSTNNAWTTASPLLVTKDNPLAWRCKAFQSLDRRNVGRERRHNQGPGRWNARVGVSRTKVRHRGISPKEKKLRRV